MPIAAEHHDALREAFVEVAGRSFFAYVDPCDPGRFADLSADVPSWVQSTVLFEGSFGGAVLIAMPETLARDLYASFMGAEPRVVAMDAPLFDLAGELANMVCGSWLTRTCERRRFALRHPEVSRMRCDEVRADADCLLLTINDQPCFVRLAFAAD